MTLYGTDTYQAEKNPTGSLHDIVTPLNRKSASCESSYNCDRRESWTHTL